MNELARLLMIIAVLLGILIQATISAYWLEKIHHVLKLLEEAQRKEKIEKPEKED